MNKIGLSILLILLSFQTQAQDNKIEMADVLRSNGKIYVVVAVMAIIFIGIVIYLFSIDKRIKKIENRK